MNKFYETLTNLRGDVLFGYRAQVVDETGASVDIYRDRSGTRFTDGSGNIVNYAEASSDTGMAEFYWTAETGHILQITDSSGELARPPIIGFGDNYVLGNLSGDLPTTAIDGLDDTLAAKADTTYVDSGLAEKVPTADLASTDPGKGDDLVIHDDGRTVRAVLKDKAPLAAITYDLNFRDYGIDLTGVADGIPALEAVIDDINALGSTGSSGVETTHIQVFMPPGVYNFRAGTTKSIDVDNVCFGGESAATTLLLVKSGTIFNLGGGMVSGRAHGCSFQHMRFIADRTGPDVADTTSLLFDLKRSAHTTFRDIQLRDVGRVIGAGTAGISAEMASSVFIEGMTGWVANLGVPTFDLQNGAGFRTNNVYLYTNIPTPVETDGTHNGAADAAALSDSTATWTPGALVGGFVKNTTDGSGGVIAANTATTVTATLSGGSDNDWDVGDSYVVIEPHQALDGQDFIKATHWDTVQTINTNCNRYDRPIHAYAASGKNINNWFLGSFIGDYNKRGILLHSDGGNIRNWRMGAGGWSFSLEGHGIELKGGALGLLDDVRIDSYMVKLSGLDGIHVGKGTNVTIRDATTAGQGGVTVGDSYGVYIGDGASARVFGGQHGINSGTTTPYNRQAKYGVGNHTGARRFAMAEVEADGATAGFALQKTTAQPAANIIRANRKISGAVPEYATSAAITVPASGAAYTNNNPGRAGYYVRGGTVSNVAKNGASISTGTNCYVELDPGETLTITYTAVPIVREEVFP